MPDRSKILIVDDDPNMCNSLLELLSVHGYEIHAANSGREALECLKESAFDLVLLDMVMPDTDGCQVMEKINRESPDTLIIIITGHASAESAIEALRRRAYDYLRKPFEVEELLKTIENALNHKRVMSDHKQAEDHIHILSQQLMKAQESERQRISRELHDRVGQDLSTLRIACETLFDDQIGVPHEIRRRVSEMSKTLQGTIMAVRDLAYDLRPPILDQLGLVRTVFQYCEDFSDRNGVNVDFYSAGVDDLKLDFDTEINLYRLIQEALNNIKKHANASNVTIRLVASSPKIILRIEDDGQGFDVKARLVTALREKRMGLRSMEQRVNLLNGKMRIRSTPMKGTKILVEIFYG